MSFGSSFDKDLGAGLTFGLAVGAARRIGEQNSTIDDLTRDYNVLVDRFNALVKEHHKTIEDRDEVKCGLIARRGEFDLLIRLLRKAYKLQKGSLDEAKILADCKRIRDEAYQNELRKLGCKIKGDPGH